MPDLFDRTWTCTGSTQVGDGAITCPHAHGEQDISSALANSCNGVFALLAGELGEDVLEEYTVRAGLTSSYRVSSLNTAAGSFDFDGLTANELGWAAWGSTTTWPTPAPSWSIWGPSQTAERRPCPGWCSRRRTPWACRPCPPCPGTQKKLVEGDTAAVLAELMAHNVTAQYGASRFPNMDVCAKSGTAEVGGGKAPPRLVRRLPPQPRRPLRLRGAGGERRLRCGRGGLRGGQGAGRGGQRILKAGPRRAAKPCAGGVPIAAPVRCAGARRGSPPPPPAPERARGGRDRQSPPPRSGRRPPPAAPP